MKRATKSLLIAAAAAGALLTAGAASASLTVFQTYVGNYGLSTDGGGGFSDYNVTAFVPVGATVTAAYLYQANYSSTGSIQPVTLNGNALSFAGPFDQSPSCCGLNSARADVTSIVAPIVNGGPGGSYDFAVHEGNTSITDGTGLVVVYQLASLSTSTVALLDGFSVSSGDTTAVSFGSPLHPGDPGFQADLRLGIGFSCCGQDSNVTVNGTLITEHAGNDDETGTDANGALITFGGSDDPFSPFLPTYAQDHERYDLTPYIADGSTLVRIDTQNPSGDDNIFFAGLVISGEGVVHTGDGGVPEPATWAMMIMGFFGMGSLLRRRPVANAA
jgi:hypothetical protein